MQCGISSNKQNFRGMAKDFLRIINLLSQIYQFTVGQSGNFRSRTQTIMCARTLLAHILLALYVSWLCRPFPWPQARVPNFVSVAVQGMVFQSKT